MKQTNITILFCTDYRSFSCYSVQAGLVHHLTLPAAISMTQSIQTTQGYTCFGPCMEFHLWSVLSITATCYSFTEDRLSRTHHLFLPCREFLRPSVRTFIILFSMLPRSINSVKVLLCRRRSYQEFTALFPNSSEQLRTTFVPPSYHLHLSRL